MPLPSRDPRGIFMKKLYATLILALALGLLAVGCGSSSDDSSSSETSASADTCEPGNLPTETAGMLTVATDKPAYPPYFEDDDPTNGEGFESAVAYAIAKQLGYPAAKVKWTVEPFNSSYAPGPKDFDFDVNQISITPAREKVVDFSAPYYTANQAVLALKDSDAAKATTIEELQDVKFGVQIGTTSLSATEEVIDPSSRPEVFNNSTDVVTALKNGQIEAIVVDLPTALYLTAVEVPEATVIGQFADPEGDEWGALLAKDSPLTECISGAVEELEASGELEAINANWMSAAAGAPLLE
jgi:polar amino acid transport system substrate-binding protein